MQYAIRNVEIDFHSDIKTSRKATSFWTRERIKYKVFFLLSLYMCTFAVSFFSFFAFWFVRFN